MGCSINCAPIMCGPPIDHRKRVNGDIKMVNDLRGIDLSLFRWKLNRHNHYSILVLDPGSAKYAVIKSDDSEFNFSIVLDLGNRKRGSEDWMVYLFNSSGKFIRSTYQTAHNAMDKAWNMAEMDRHRETCRSHGINPNW